MKILKKMLPLLAVLPFIIGAAGYIIAGKSISDALYLSFALYFVSQQGDTYNILVDISRWTAAAVTTSAVMYAAKRLWIGVVRFVRCHAKDSIAVYGDKNIEFDKKHFGIIYPGNEFKAAPHSQIIMLETDEKSLEFYEEHKAELKNRKVYIGLKDTDPAALKNKPDLSFFDIGSAIARTMWKQAALWEKNTQKAEITILGTDHLGQCVLNCGLLINLFSAEQEIIYNFIGSSGSYRLSYGEMNTFNRDKVRYFDYPTESAADVIGRSDIVVITKKVSIEEIRTISLICSGKIYFYSPHGRENRYFDLPNAEPFGMDCDIYTDENIRQSKLFEAAMEQNYQYILSRPDNGSVLDRKQEWNKLSSFSKWSNIASADYKPILAYLGANGADTEELSELEHIRWCRFHILNHWKYGRIKDPEKKIHSCLCAYDELSEEDKEKDRAIVREAVK